MCHPRDKRCECAHCGHLVEPQMVRKVLFYGVLLCFCNVQCQGAFWEAWLGERQHAFT